MKKLLVFAFVLWALSLGAQISDYDSLEYHLDLTVVQPTFVGAEFRVHNPTAFTWENYFYHDMIALLKIDDEYCMGGYPDYFSISLYPGQTLTIDLSALLFEPLSPGVHVAQACMPLQDGYQLVGNIEVIYNQQLMNELDELTWDLQITNVYADSLTASLSYTNPSAEPWYHDYYSVPLFYLRVDGYGLGGFMYVDFPFVYVLEPGETHTQELVYRNYEYVDGAHVLTNFTPGLHILQAFSRFTDGGAVGWPLSFTIGSAASDEIIALPELSAYPNPFVADTRIRLGNSEVPRGILNIYNLKGQKVRNLAFNKGNECLWDGKDESGNSVANGVYIIRQNKSEARPVKILKLNQGR